VSPAGRRVLLVEDDPDLRDALVDGLRERSYQVVAVANGREALEALRGQGSDVVVLDLMMPVMDGWEFRVAQRRDPELAGTPVVAVSAAGHSTAAAIDADAYIEKPLRLPALTRTIDAVVQAHERRREAAEAAKAERLASLGVLAAGLAHEINNPLTCILLELRDVADIVRGLASGRDADATETIARRVAGALEGAERISEIVQGVRAFAREDDSSKFPLDVRPLLDRALKMVDHMMSKRARIERDYQECPFVLASEGRLTQVLLNLLANAAQAIPEGRPDANLVTVSTRTGDDGSARIAIADTGPGIPEALIGRIFEPFFTTKPVGEGIGLGLSLSHGIVRGLGGEIRVTSALGAGTTFEIVLPSAMQMLEAMTGSSAGPPHSSSP
jgi:C4-dicarboxylate-specific signal transduction histidine kinase